MSSRTFQTGLEEPVQLEDSSEGQTQLPDEVTSENEPVIVTRPQRRVQPIKLAKQRRRKRTSAKVKSRQKVKYVVVNKVVKK